MNKKDGGILTNWTVHNLNFTPEEMEKAYPGANALPMIVTAIVVEDHANRGWTPGYHMRTSCVVAYYKMNGILETINTIYKLEGPEGDPYFPESLGNGVLNIHY